MKKGFTLIELMAVIVILAIIALIATPIVMNIIENGKKGTAESSMANVDHAAEVYFYNKKLDSGFNGITFKCRAGSCTSGEENLKISGTIPEDGEIIIDKQGNIVLSSLLINGYICSKNNDEYMCEKTSGKEGASTTNGVLILSNSKTTTISNYIIKGNSVQNGTPSMTAPVEIESVGNLVTDSNNSNYGKYEIPIRVTGKNLLDYKSFIADGKTFEIENGLQYENLTGTHNVTIDFTFKANTKYILSANITGNIYVGGQLWNNFTSYTWISKDTPSITIYNNTNEDITRTIYCRLLNGSADITSAITNLQLEISETKTDYEPYNGKTYSIYLDEPLRKVGDYADEINFETGEITRYIYEYKFTGKEIWYNHSEYSALQEGYNVFFATSPKNSVKPFANSLLSNYFNYILGSYRQSNSGNSISFESSGTTIYLKQNKYSSASELSGYISDLYENNVPIKIVYPLSVSNTEKITLPSININRGILNITVDTEIKPSEMTIYYYK